ncbi:MAG: transcriptional regulator [Alphaproteobacteria bacterium]|nr:transcriptional regulator [Alphaproteobacteria bacterium]
MTEENQSKLSQSELLHMVADVVSAYVSNNQVLAGQLPEVIKSIYSSLAEQQGGPREEAAEALKPAVPIRKSITPEFLICLENGKKLKMLKRHLHTFYNLSPEEYRAKWGLPLDYPMVAPNYAKQRSEFAKQIGLGRSKRTKARR